MAFSMNPKTIGTSPVLIHTGADGEKVWVSPTENGIIFVGPSNVTINSGFPVVEEFHIASSALGDDLYAVTGGQNVRVRVLIQP